MPIDPKAAKFTKGDLVWVKPLSRYGVAISINHFTSVIALDPTDFNERVMSRLVANTDVVRAAGYERLCRTVWW